MYEGTQGHINQGHTHKSRTKCIFSYEEFYYEIHGTQKELRIDGISLDYLQELKLNTERVVLWTLDVRSAPPQLL